MTRRGSALLAALWLVVVLAAATAGVLARTRTGLEASRNRIWLRRAEWAREACVQLLISHRGAEPPGRVGPIDLGRGAWCSAAVAPVAGRINLNLADPDVLTRLLGDDSLAAALLDWRDPDDLPRPGGAEAAWYRTRGRRLPRNGAFASVEELALVRGFDSLRLAEARQLLTVNGTGTLDLTQAPAQVLAALPGMTPSAAEQIVRQRRYGRSVGSLGELMALLGPTDRHLIAAGYARLEAMTATTSPLFEGIVTSGIDGTPVRSRLEVMLQVADRRLAVVGRRPT